MKCRKQKKQLLSLNSIHTMENFGLKFRTYKVRYQIFINENNQCTQTQHRLWMASLAWRSSDNINYEGKINDSYMKPRENKKNPVV